MEKYDALVTINEKTYERKIRMDRRKKYLYYIDNDKEQTINVFDYDKKVLKRDNQNIYLELYFKENEKTKCNLFLKEETQNLELEVLTKKIIMTEDKIVIEYELNEELYQFKIEKIRRKKK